MRLLRGGGAALFAAVVAINHGSNNKHQSSAASVVSASTFITALASDQPPIYLCITPLPLLCLTPFIFSLSSCLDIPSARFSNPKLIPTHTTRRNATPMYTPLPFATLSDVTLDVRKCPYASWLVNYLQRYLHRPSVPSSTLIN